MNYENMLNAGRVRYFYVHPALKILAVLILVIGIGFVGRGVEAAKEGRSCAAARAQGLNPQQLLDSGSTTVPNPYRRFDHDNDGKACE